MDTLQSALIAAAVVILMMAFCSGIKAVWRIMSMAVGVINEKRSERTEKKSIWKAGVRHHDDQ